MPTGAPGSTRTPMPAGFQDVLSFPLLQALLGRRARRFTLGASIPDGPLAYTSRHQPMPLDELEQMLVLLAAGGNTGWHYAINRNAHYAPHFPNYAGAAGGRTFPSAAGFHTSELFFTDDNGVYLFATRDAPALAEKDADGSFDLEALLEAHRGRIRKLDSARLQFPREEPFVEGHNTWCANLPGSTLVIPVADLAQHLLAILCFLTQNGYCITNDLNDEPVPGMKRFRHLVNEDAPLPLSFVEQYALTEATAELACSCYAGVLMLQAMGLGGWMYDGIDRHTILGATGDPRAPGLRFRYDTHPRWALPNPTGLPGVFEAFCPPHYPNMRAAVDALCERKFGKGGPFHAGTPGAWKESPRVRGAAKVHDPEFRECVATQAQYIFHRFGKFPGTVPSVFCLTYLQAQHLDPDFYDTHFQPGAYLPTHARHMERWHADTPAQ
ncbi:hypothetical protein [Myxococcus sp. RHSTA-1-4]|uniref:hypothetical protein n=1 Tax=Myxococcus sp. RHSTA-1-4 TaxID=2874601 RepID=UPI001CBE0288|nr:hypothetical protein [Myxococcus sp. RHSTA-1-4]MBZ4419268.1 hypothetical protein [Myxococcus sp. RHSTA-1-4]